MLLTVTLIIFSFPSQLSLSVQTYNLPFSSNPSHCSLSFSSLGLATWFPKLLLLLLACPFLLFSFSVLHFVVVVSVRWIRLTHIGFRAHVKIASRTVSYRNVVVRRLTSLPCCCCSVRVPLYGFNTRRLWADDWTVHVSAGSYRSEVQQVCWRTTACRTWIMPRWA